VQLAGALNGSVPILMGAQGLDDIIKAVDFKRLALLANPLGSEARARTIDGMAASPTRSLARTAFCRCRCCSHFARSGASA